MLKKCLNSLLLYEENLYRPQLMLHLKRILLVTLLFPYFGLSQEADIQEGKALFNTNCAACHQLNRKAVGPALRGVTEKYDREWLYSWIKNGTQMIKDGDPQAVAIWEEI